MLEFIGTIFSLRKSMKDCDISKVKKYLLIIFFFTISAIEVFAQNTYSNKVFNSSIKSAQVYPMDDPLGTPYIGLNSGEKLTFHFDEMEGDVETYYFGAIHCTQNWTKSNIESTAYLQGFPSDRISEVENSFNTMYEFVHYEFTFPNDMSKPRYSGNYLMVVSSSQDLSDESDWIVSYCFVVYELAVNLVASVKPSSVIADRFKKQQVDFAVYHKDFKIFDPWRDVSATIIQNNNWNNAIIGLSPVFVKMDELTFDYSAGENSFYAGKEWRNFEMKNLNFASIEVETIVYEQDGYNVYLRPDIPEGGKVHSSSTDLNGNYFIKNDLSGDYHVESEYVWVNFFLQMAEIPESEVIIEGRFAEFDAQPYICRYDRNKRGYVAKILMKQGYYNYRYAVRDRYHAFDDISYTEGSDVQTENDYTLIIYMHDSYLESDRVIALRSLNSVSKK